MIHRFFQVCDVCVNEANAGNWTEQLLFVQPGHVFGAHG